MGATSTARVHPRPPGRARPTPGVSVTGTTGTGRNQGPHLRRSRSDPVVLTVTHAGVFHGDRDRECVNRTARTAATRLPARRQSDGRDFDRAEDVDLHREDAGPRRDAQTLTGALVTGVWDTAIPARSPTGAGGDGYLSTRIRSEEVRERHVRRPNHFQTGYSYAAASNHYPDGGSTGTTIKVVK